jgi:hypothetical protein
MIMTMGMYIESKLHGYLTVQYKLIRQNIDICTVNRDKKFWWNLVIWGKRYGVIYMGGRQIFEMSHEVHKRGG